MSLLDISHLSEIYIKQVYEPYEFIGFETRNKYSIYGENKKLIGYAAEPRLGIWDSVFRQVFKHWRNFDIHIYNNERQKVYNAHHPFRFFFQRLEITDKEGKLIGVIQKKFALLRKRFDIEGPRGETLFTIRAGFFRIWTFPILKNGNEVARINKKMGKILTELFTDKDSFQLCFSSKRLTHHHKVLLMVTVLLVDLQFFENNKSSVVDLIPN